MKYFALFKNRVYPPSIMVPVSEGTVFEFKKVFNKSKIKHSYNYWRNKRSAYFYRDDEMTKTVDDLLKEAVKNPRFLYFFYDSALNKAISLNKFANKYYLKNLEKIDSEELLDYYVEFYDQFMNFYAYGTALVLIGYRDDNPIYNKMNSILKEKVKDKPAKFAEYLTILTSPLKKLKSHDLELNILQLAKQAKEKNLKTVKDILNNFKAKLEAIHKEFGVLSFDYNNDSTWNLETYAEDVVNKLEINIDKRIEYLNNYENNVNTVFNNLVKELNLTKEEINIFKLVADTGYYKWAREYQFQEAVYKINFIQNELGKRIGLDEYEVKYILVDELKEKFNKPEELKDLSTKRMDRCLFIASDKGREFYYADQAEKMFTAMEFVEDKIDRNIKEVTGMPAKAGQAKGRVKIIDTVEDMVKMEQGDILISNATNPDLMPAIRKAAAIVTNEGGITCHAAIVSRELNIPCIVGTKIITEILKDGDIVEVDANQGIVKIL